MVSEKSVWITKPIVTYIVLYCHRNSMYLKDVDMELKLTEYKKLPSKRECLLSYIDIFFKRCIILDETTIHNLNRFYLKLGVFLSVSIIRLYPKVKLNFCTIVLEKTSSQSRVTVWTSQFLYQRWTQKLFQWNDFFWNIVLGLYILLFQSL